ncbi:MAG: hypothetical protein HYU66_25180 [Armatimonadetes bacterium]|nr:hypothetical protein [Armatimonadota bacterium]
MTLEGVHQNVLRYHYDLSGDVLYLRLLGTLDEEVHGEEDDNGFHILRSYDTERVVGVTIVGYWRRFGNAPVVPDAAALAAVLEQAAAQLGAGLLAA